MLICVRFVVKTLILFQSEDDQGDSLEPPEVRSIDELRMYDKFFPEVFEFDVSAYSLETYCGGHDGRKCKLC